VLLLLFFAVLAPAAGLLWFMNAAMRNERFAVHQRLIELYRGHLAAVQARLETEWRRNAIELESAAATNSPASAFAQAVFAGAVDGIVILGPAGENLYPNQPSGAPGDNGEAEPRWVEARQREFLRHDPEGAAGLYHALAGTATNLDLAARAWQSEARCRFQAGQTNAAIGVVEERGGGERFRAAVDAQGRCIAANAELLALELVGDAGAPRFRAIARRLQARLQDYANPSMAAPQRRFLMKELQRLAPAMEFPTLEAEELTCRFAGERLGAAVTTLPPLMLQPTVLRDTWQFVTPSRRVLGLVRTARIASQRFASDRPGWVPAGTEVALLPPEAAAETAFVSAPAGDWLPGWRLALSLKDRTLLDTTMQHRTGIYLWTGVWVLAGVGVLTWLAVRRLRRQVALARLKNDLAATVSHELKTPLSSMRVLVDTLLDSEQFSETTVREYLQLIAQENERLSRVIQNFLTFARMERGQPSFHLELLPARRIVDGAVAAMRERLSVAGCPLEIVAAGDLPQVLADENAMVVALGNLLDNACKYSEEPKPITLRAGTERGMVKFAVEDHGVGIPAREARRIFRPFYQIDPHLSRTGGGCGLGLSIVRSIMAAHGGNVAVESRPGHGSVFTLSLPIAARANAFREESICESCVRK
jgi:signal transduction histidine kinase